MGTRMRNRTIWGLAALLLLAGAAQAAPPDAPVPAPKAGNITALLPTANIVRGPAKQEVTALAKKGDDVAWNDLIRTDKGGRARITLLDQSILSVGSQAQLRVIKSDAKSQQTSIEVGYGRVRMEVTPITQQGGSFEVKTPTAVAGVIGTTFGVDSAIGSTTFLCVSGTTMVGSNDPAIPSRVACTAGMAAVVSAGKAPTTRPATQQELQQLVQDTEPAVISAMTPSSLSPGATADASITGTQLGSINAVSSSTPSVTATLNPGGTATSIGVHLVVAANAAPGPVTLTLSRPSGVNSAAVFTISPGQAAAGNAPSIQGLSTTSAPAGGGSTVTITGANFDANTKVMFGNVASSNVTFVSSTQLTAITPPGNPGPVDLTVVTGGGMTATLSGGFSFGGPVAAINPLEITLNPGAALTLDGSQSSDTLAGTTLSYGWTFCSLGFKPPQAGASLSALNAPVCTPATGTVPGTDSTFALTPPVVPGQYFARLQVTDNLGASAVIYASVTVSQPNYLDPLTCTTLLAQAFSTLQTGSATGSGCGSGGPATVLGFFDPSFPGLTTLQQSLQGVFLTYSSMQAHLVGPQLSASGNVAIVTANWQLLYTIKNDPACAHTTPCQPPTYQSSLGTVTTVWTLTPGKGYAVTDFRYQNGFGQGTLPAVPNTTASQPDLMVTAVVRTAPQTFQATVQNSGSAASGPTTVHFVLISPPSTQIGTADGNVDAVPAGGSGIATATINLSSVTQNITAQITATVNPNCTVQESSCSNNTSTFNVDLVPLNVPLPDLTITAVSVAGESTPPFVIGTGLQQFQATVSNIGQGALTSPATVHFAVTDSLGDPPFTADGTVPALAAGASSPVAVSITIPTTIPQGTNAQLTVTANPGCAIQESSCNNNSTGNLAVVLGVPPAIIVTSSAGNTTNTNPVELNGPLTDALTLTATRSDNVTTGSVTLGLTETTVTSTPPQLTSIPYRSPQPVDFNAAIDGSGNVTTGPASVLVTPSQAVPAAGPQTTTLYFNIGDITLSLPSGTTCIQIGAGNQAPVPSFSINAISGFNVPTVTWQWSGLSGVTVNQVSGTSNLAGATYALPAFTFTVTTPETATFLFAVTVANGQGSATKAFSLTFNLSATPCGSAGRLGVGGVGGGVSGTWSRGGFGGGMAKAVTPTKTGPLPDLQINASSVSFSPSIPKPGDTVSVRFRVTNAGNADAQRVPIALVVNGAAVASETFDVRAGTSTLAALAWPDAHSVSGHGALQAAVVVDPNHTVAEQSTLAKSAPLAHFTLLASSVEQTAGQTGGAQRATLELADGGCVGFRFASGAGSACGSADVEISAEQLSSGHFTLSAQIGIADLGSAFGGGKLAVVQYEQEAPAIAGHSYAVQLRGGKTGILRLMAIRNPGQTAAASGQVFGGSKVAGKVGAGPSSGPVETGDVSGVRTPGRSKAYFEVSYQTQ